MTDGSINGAVAFTRTGAVANLTPVAHLGYAVYAHVGWWGGEPQTITTAAGVLTGYSTTGQSSFSVACAAGGCTGAAAGDVANTGINFGTWDRGTVNYSWTGTAGPQHWITGPAAGPAYLPQVLLGTVSYKMSGGSAPTNSARTAGTQNYAALTVNFTQQTVALALSATAGGNTFVVSTPAGGGAPLNSYYSNGDGNAAFWFNVNCIGCVGDGSVNLLVNGAAPTSAWGQVSGQLTGQGLTGAILSYNLNATFGTNSVTDSIQGVAALSLETTTLINAATPYRTVGAVISDNVAVAGGFYGSGGFEGGL